MKSHGPREVKQHVPGHTGGWQNITLEALLLSTISEHNPTQIQAKKQWPLRVTRWYVGVHGTQVLQSAALLHP